MKITLERLKKIIKEELGAVINEDSISEKKDKLKLLRLAVTLAELAQGAKEDKLGAEIVTILDDAWTKLFDDLIKSSSEENLDR